MSKFWLGVCTGAVFVAAVDLFFGKGAQADFFMWVAIFAAIIWWLGKQEVS